jgi:hypothetical protein
MASDFHVARRDAPNDHSGHPFSTRRHGVAALKREYIVIVLGVILLILGLVLDISILYTIGVILLIIGVILWILGATGRAVGGRPHYW